MTSAINYTSIDENYPIPGQDNNSQGFRDNFNVIKVGLGQAKTEITALQTNAVTKGVTNDLNLGIISNGSYNNFYGRVYANSNTITQDANISVIDGSLQKFVMGADLQFTFTDWPSDPLIGSIRVHFVSSGSATFNVTLQTESGGTIRKQGTFPNPLAANLNGKHQVIEAWSFDNGATVFVRYLGEY